MIADIIMKNYGKLLVRQIENDGKYVPFSAYQDWIIMYAVIVTAKI